jgi:hypothetical protein
MTGWPRMLAVCSWLLVVCAASAGAQEPEGWDIYLGEPRGPYRGQVLDADTKTPLAGAVVAAYWRRERVHPFHSTKERYAVREVVTDREGRFDLDAKDIEANAPKRTLHPEFRIFVPGYGAFPGFNRSPRGFIGGVFWGRGATVELARLDSREQRIRSMRSVDPYDWSDSPFFELPRLMEAFNKERVSLGLDPLPRQEGEK